MRRQQALVRVAGDGAESKGQRLQAHMQPQATNLEDAKQRVRSRCRMRTPPPPRTEAVAQEFRSAKQVGVPSGEARHDFRPVHLFRPPRIGKQPSFAGSECELAGQEENTLDVERLGKQIDQMGPFDPVSKRHKGPQIPGQGGRIT